MDCRKVPLLGPRKAEAVAATLALVPREIPMAERKEEGAYPLEEYNLGQAEDNRQGTSTDLLLVQLQGTFHMAMHQSGQSG